MPLYRMSMPLKSNLCMDCCSEEQQSLLLSNQPYRSHSDGTGMRGSRVRIKSNIHTYIQTHACTRIHTCMHTHTHKHTYIHTHTYTHTYRHMLTHAYTYIHSYTHIQTLTCAHTYRQTLTCAHTHRHMYKAILK